MTVSHRLPLPVFHGDRVGVRGGGRLQRLRVWPPLTLTLSPCLKRHGEREKGCTP
jgi:hypothetical protein